MPFGQIRPQSDIVQETVQIHVLRSPSIYNVFLRMGLVTDAGSGIPHIIARVRKFTDQSPVWKVEGNEFVLVLPRPVT